MNFVRSEQLVLGVGDDGSIVNEEKKIEKTVEEQRKMRVLEMPEFRKYRSTLADRGEFDPEEGIGFFQSFLMNTGRFRLFSVLLSSRTSVIDIEFRLLSLRWTP